MKKKGGYSADPGWLVWEKKEEKLLQQMIILEWKHTETHVFDLREFRSL